MNSIVDRLIHLVDIEFNLVPFLKYSGWDEVESKNSRWIVLQGASDVDGKPIQMVFPRHRTEEEGRKYAVKAVEILSALENEPLQLTLQSVINYDRDMLYIRNTDTGQSDAISLNLAVGQVYNLRRTIEYSACSEKEAKPYFLSRSPIAKTTVRDFLFGHTFAGSFGFTVESPRLPDPPKFIQQRLPLNGDDAPPPVDVPFVRRVFERIARGLNYAKQAENEKNHRILIDEYASGFNSNMCSAIVGMSQDKRATVEFRIRWSPKIKAGDDVIQSEPIQLRTNGYDILEYAAKELKTTKPEHIRFVGHIRALTASDNPYKPNTRRAVVIRGVLPEIKRLVDVIVELDREDYAKANEAHIGWQNIEVSGVLSRSGTAWRLIDVRNFRVL